MQTAFVRCWDECGRRERRHGLRFRDCRICRYECWDYGECRHGRLCSECRLCEFECDRKRECWRCLYHIIRKQSFELLRKESRRRELAVDVPPDAIPCCDGGCSCLYCDCIVRCDIRDAVCKLREDYRTITLLHYWCGLTLDEIARYLGLSWELIYRKHHRAKKVLRTELATYKFMRSCDCSCRSQACCHLGCNESCAFKGDCPRSGK